MMLMQPFAGNGAGGNAHRRLARALPAAAAVIANAVFLPVRVVRVAGTEAVGNFCVVLAALVFVAYQQCDRRAGGLALEHAGENFDAIAFAPLRDVARGTGLAPVKVALDVFGGKRQPRRAAIDDAADRRPVRFAERGDAI